MARGRRHLVREATTNQIATVKNLVGFIANREKHVYHTTISKSHTSCLHGRVERRKQLLKKECYMKLKNEKNLAIIWQMVL